MMIEGEPCTNIMAVHNLLLQNMATIQTDYKSCDHTGYKLASASCVEKHFLINFVFNSFITSFVYGSNILNVYFLFSRSNIVIYPTITDAFVLRIFLNMNKDFGILPCRFISFTWYIFWLTIFIIKVPKRRIIFLKFLRTQNLPS